MVWKGEREAERGGGRNERKGEKGGRKERKGEKGRERELKCDVAS